MAKNEALQVRTSGSKTLIRIRSCFRGQRPIFKDERSCFRGQRPIFKDEFREKGEIRIGDSAISRADLTILEATERKNRQSLWCIEHACCSNTDSLPDQLILFPSQLHWHL